MKVVILAGGMGTRLSEETEIKPKPMVEIGGKPILWHILKIYSQYGYNDFVICLGYKGYYIKEYFANYFLHQCDVTFDFRNHNKMEIHSHNAEPWKVTLVDTGLNTMTGGRLKCIRDYIDDSPFMVTYGDGVGNVNIEELVKFHRSRGKLATLTSVQPQGRFGSLLINENDSVTSFAEKPKGDGSWINAGFFVLEPQVFDLIEDDKTVWEKEPLEQLAIKSELAAYKHSDFWRPMDTLRDKIALNELWDNHSAPWKTWSN